MRMARIFEKRRGIFERPKGSNVWWISFVDQFKKRHREKVGCRSDAIKEYMKRKTEIRLAKFPPQDVKAKHQTILLSELITDYLEKNELEHRSFGDTKRRSLWWHKY